MLADKTILYASLAQRRSRLTDRPGLVMLYATLQRTFSRGPSDGFIEPMPDHVPAKLSSAGSACNGLMLTSARQAAPTPIRAANEFKSILPILIRNVRAVLCPDRRRMLAKML